MNAPLRVLHVEDSPQDADLIRMQFEKAGRDVAWTRVESEADYVAALDASPDVVIADYQLPGFDGRRALALLKERRPDIPFVLVSGTIGEEKAAEITRLGADDYLSKNHLGRIVRAVADALDRAEQRKARAEIEAGLRRAQLMAKLAHVITGPDGAFESWSETLPQLAGVEPERLPGSTRGWLQLIHPRDRDLFRARAVEAVETRQRTELEYCLQRPDGALINVRQTMEPLGAAQREPCRMRWFNTLQDVSDQVRAQAALRESEGLKRAIIEASLDALVTIDESGMIVEFNPAAETIFGLRRELALGRPMAELIIPPRYREAHTRGLARHLASGEAPLFGRRVELEARRADGSEFPVEIAVVPIPGRATRTFAGFVRDITQRKLADKRIRRLNRVYAVLSGINAAIMRIGERQELFDEACRVAVAAGHFALAWIGVVDAQASIVRPAASAGEARDLLDNSPFALSGGDGLAGRTVSARAAVVSNDVRNDPQVLMRTALEERGIHSAAAVPLVLGRDVIGVFCLYAAEAGVFDNDEIRLLTELAGDVVFALDHIEKSKQLEYLAYFDPLTGLANRRLLLERLEQRVIAAEHARNKLAVSIVDVVRFKAFNDALGRQTGDELLRQIGQRITQAGPDPTRVARIGADHFVIVSADLETADDVGRLTEQRLDACFSPPFSLVGQELRVSARIGIALFPSDGRDAETLITNAEAALKKAKATGERYLFFAPAMTARIRETLSLENKLRRALERDEFVLHYQPKVELETGRIAGVEALIRWQSPELGLVLPAKFIPLLEETGLILQAGAWALGRAALDHRAWAEAGLKPPRVSVNVSAVQLRQRDFVGIVEKAVREGLAPTGIDLEITESLVMEDIVASIEKLTEVRRLGIGVAIDDFGTGYSSLAYLARLPVQMLKIDRSFIVTMASDPDTMTLVQTIISLAHSLRLKVVAEGVETEEQANILRLLHCDQMQGYLVSRPAPMDEMTRLLLAGQAGKSGQP
ncbi:MAG: EAL domain-containing protein [Candidatus Binataceae bacterium]|nr:EAL domain-containing protein [Candidatus Binataceae bacterium]